MEDGPKFIQISATSESDGKGNTATIVYALDENGSVWKFHDERLLKTAGWIKLPATRRLNP